MPSRSRMPPSMTIPVLLRAKIALPEIVARGKCRFSPCQIGQRQWCHFRGAYQSPTSFARRCAHLSRPVPATRFWKSGRSGTNIHVTAPSDQNTIRVQIHPIPIKLKAVAVPLQHTPTPPQSLPSSFVRRCRPIHEVYHREIGHLPTLS